MHHIDVRIEDMAVRAASYASMAEGCKESAKWSTNSADRAYWKMLEECHRRTVESSAQIMDMLLKEREGTNE